MSCEVPEPAEDPGDELEQWFHQALELPPAGRADLLRTLEDRSRALAHELRRYLDALDAAPEFLARPASLGLLAGLKDAAEDADDEPTPRTALRPGLRVGSFELLQRLGAGASGEVWEARQTRPDRRVAVKILARHADPGAERRFAAEAETLARLDHPHVARVLGAGTDALGDGSGLPWLAMELIRDARPLTEHTAGLPLRARIELFLGVVSGVQHAHQRGVLHRDLKPANVLVPSSGEGGPRLIDFGIARLVEPVAERGLATTRQGELLGSLHWMSPEHAAGDPAAIDARSDVYSLGVLLYEVVCGVPPLDLRGRSLLQALHAIRHEAPADPATRSPEVDRDLAAVLGQALAKDPERRYASAAALGDDLCRWLEREPVLARQAGILHRIGLFARRRRRVFAASVLGVLAGLAAVATIVVLWLETDDALQALLQARSAESAQRDAAQTARAELDDVRRELDQLLDEERPSLPGRIARNSARRVADAETPAERRATVLRSVRILERIADDLGDDPAARRALAEAFDDLARLHGSEWMASAEDAAPNRIAHRRSYELWSRLADEFPGDRTLQEQAIVSGEMRVQNDRKMGAEPGDVVFADEVVARARGLVEHSEADARSRRRLASALWARCDLHIHLPERAQGVADAFEALAIHRRLTEVEAPRIADVHDLAWSLLRVGIWQHRELSDPVAALRTFREMTDRRIWLLERHGDPAGIALEALTATEHLWTSMATAGQGAEITRDALGVLAAFDAQLRGPALRRTLVGALHLLHCAATQVPEAVERERLRVAARELLGRVARDDTEPLFDGSILAQRIRDLGLGDDPAARAVLQRTMDAAQHGR